MQVIKKTGFPEKSIIVNVGLFFRKLCTVSEDTNTIPYIVESVLVEMHIDFQTPCILWGHRYLEFN